MIGRQLGRYEVRDKLGAGGMGEVYRAHDTRLQRDVAIKVLPAGALQDDIARQRFEKEALALSRLNHPNIATIHDFDTVEEIDFLVMEHVDGESLASVLQQSAVRGPQALHLATQMAEGLAAAHAQGVVHGDLKPANILVTSDVRVKILDFGLARITRSESEKLTTESIAESEALQGTLPYMAPELLRGTRADFRTDIYALGATWYEMITGQRAFAAAGGVAQLVHAILHTSPEPLGPATADVPLGLLRSIPRAMAKERDQRFATTRELLDALRAPESVAPFAETADLTQALDAETGEPAPARRQSRPRRVGLGVLGLVTVIAAAALLAQFAARETRQGERIMAAVLPLRGLGVDAEDEFFREGMTEELITALGRLNPERLGIIGRTSAMRYRETNLSLAEIGRELEVQYLLEGSVRQHAGRIRITTQLVRVSDQSQMWGDTFDRRLEDVLAVQKEVALEVANALALQLLDATGSQAADSVDAEAYLAYLRGRYNWNKRTADGLRRALQSFRFAAERDPDYAIAHVGVADTWLMLGEYGYVPFDSALAATEDAVAVALQLDPSLGMAHNALAWARTIFDRDWAGAEGQFLRAQLLSPEHPTTHQWYAEFLNYQGRHEEALAAIERALALDPLSPLITMVKGWLLLCAERFPEAIEQLEASLALDPSFRIPWVYLSITQMCSGDLDAALESARKYEGEGVFAAAALAAKGKPELARRLLRDSLRRESGEFGNDQSFDRASILTALGEQDEAIAALVDACNAGSVRVLSANVAPWLAPLRSNPNFDRVLDCIGLTNDASKTPKHESP